MVGSCCSSSPGEFKGNNDKYKLPGHCLRAFSVCCAAVCTWQPGALQLRGILGSDLSPKNHLGSHGMFDSFNLDVFKIYGYKVTAKL